jgi:hypothetical protein
MPVIGLNNNVERNGITYHIQTEDSGLANPHIFTHIFVDGVILSTKRVSYEHLLKRDDLARCIQTLMRWQHRQMYQELMNGSFDAPSVDTASINLNSSGEFLTASAPMPTEPELAAVGSGYQFGAKYLSARPFAEVVLSFLEKRRIPTGPPPQARK